MTIQECYAQLQGDDEDVLARLRTDRLVQKFMLKFLDDPSYDALCAAMAVLPLPELPDGVHCAPVVLRDGLGQRFGIIGPTLSQRVAQGGFASVYLGF